MENKKTKAKSYYQANKEKLQKKTRKCHRNLSEDEKIKKKKEVMLTIETKIKKMKIEKKKECLNNCNYKKIIISFN